ncbi:pimeloyl-ACP methyl esterase BioG family protein [Fusobacterium sp.]|uniref:pimeloyl-ACP methyl esterase BioG family protein n=1 Tax=Fusobacterium sp. TaxID=68766 RepID=UPI00396CA24B
MKLILFFNGWGMDETILKNLIIPKGWILEVINFPYTVNIDLTEYENTVFIGWSFGCHYLAKYIHKHKITSKQTVAINGHSENLGKYGIPLKMFNLTLKTLSPETLIKFYKNMGLEDNFTPKHDFQLIKNELAYFGEHFFPIDNPFTYAYIGKNDRIIPTARQIDFFKKNNVNITLLDGEHYLFDKQTLLEDIVERVTNEL